MHELIKLVLSLVYIATLLHGLGKQLKSEGNVPGVKSEEDNVTTSDSEDVLFPDAISRSPWG